MIRVLTSLALSMMGPAVSDAQDDVARGRLVHIDGERRAILLSDGSRYVVGKDVKMSARRLGEEVLVSYRLSAFGREALKIRRAPASLSSPSGR
jgi:hypothetical protein